MRPIQDRSTTVLSDETFGQKTFGFGIAEPNTRFSYMNEIN